MTKTGSFHFNLSCLSSVPSLLFLGVEAQWVCKRKGRATLIPDLEDFLCQERVCKQKQQQELCVCTWSSNWYFARGESLHQGGLLDWVWCGGGRWIGGSVIWYVDVKAEGVAELLIHIYILFYHTIFELSLWAHSFKEAFTCIVPVVLSTVAVVDCICQVISVVSGQNILLFIIAQLRIKTNPCSTALQLVSRVNEMIPNCQTAPTLHHLTATPFHMSLWMSSKILNPTGRLRLLL